MIDQVLMYVFTVALLAGYAFLIWKFSQKKKNTKPLIYFLMLIPRITGLALVFTLGLLLLPATIIILLIALLLIIESILWIETAYLVASQKKVVWFIIILFVPLLGWLLYRLTELG